ncbi:MAG: hypothetical protein WKF37_00525 [Bryobacteraceae bacterium]
MTCIDFEVLLCDSIDGRLDSEQRQALEQHRQECKACSDFAIDVSAAVVFIGRTEPVRPPDELLTRIAFSIPRESKASRSLRTLFGDWLTPVLQPKFAMGMAMTILSFSLLGRFAGIEVRQLTAADLHPVKVWAAVDDRVHRTWVRGVKYYENLQLVFEVQTRLQEWNEQEEVQRGAKSPVSPEGERRQK